MVARVFVIFLFLALHSHCFFLAVNFLFLAWFLYGIFFSFPPFALLSFLCLSAFSMLWFSFFTPLLHSLLLSGWILFCPIFLGPFLMLSFLCSFSWFKPQSMHKTALCKPSYNYQLYMFTDDFSSTAYCLPLHAPTQDSSYTFVSVCTAPSSTYLHTHHTHA